MLNAGDWLSGNGDSSVYILERICRGEWGFTYIVIQWSDRHRVATLRTMFDTELYEYYTLRDDECWWLPDAFEYLSKQRG